MNSQPPSEYPADNAASTWPRPNWDDIPRELFPLRLTSMEQYHWLDDSPEFPNQFFGRLYFDRGLHRDALEVAHEWAQRRHLRGNCRLLQLRGRWFWEAPAPYQPLTWVTTPDATHPPLDLTQRGGYQAQCFAGPDGSQISVQTHHALADGLAGLSFLVEWLKIYDNLLQGKNPAEGLPELVPERLRNRSRTGVASWRYWRGLWRQPIAVYGAAKFLGKRFGLFPGSAPPGGGQGAGAAGEVASPAEVTGQFPCGVTRVWPRERVLKLRPLLNRRGLTLNDLLIATLLGALTRYSQTRWGISPRESWRVIIPISIRERWDQRMPAANRSTLVQLDRPPTETKDLWQLAHGIHFELGVIRQWMLDRAFLLAVGLLSKIPGGLAATVGKHRARATTLLTNLGKPLVHSGLPHSGRWVVVGGARLTGLELLPPIRASLPVSFAAAQYAGDLVISAHLDWRYVTAAAVDEFLANWFELLEQVASETT